MKHRTPLVLVYGVLVAAWGVLAAWQIVEHRRVQEAQRTFLINRAGEIATTLGQVISEQRRGRFGSFGPDGVVILERLEPTLKALIRPGEVNLVAVLNADGETVASAAVSSDTETNNVAGAKAALEKKTIGRAVELMAKAQTIQKPAVLWEPGSVTVVHPVDIGEIFLLPMRGPPRGGPRGPRPNEAASTNVASADIGPSQAGSVIAETQRAPGDQPPGPAERARREGPSGRPGPGPPPRQEDDPRSFRERHEKQILHGFAVVMSTTPFREARIKDLWVRAVVTFFGSLAVLGLGLAWRNVARSSELQMRLLRASELNTHLREMNIAAAGLAHETRNPLNIIRGVAQMISQESQASPQVRTKSREIINEVDRVTGQLTEFINYSRPREVRRAPVVLSAVISDVARALKFDLEDKEIQLSVGEDNLTVQADEKLLRQVLFNLLMNAIQAVASKGEIQIVARRSDSAEAFLEIRDNGPGVPSDHRQEIFKPYFTTTQNGTGLGLAVVQHIVLAHGWDIECLPNEPKGAVFRINHLKLSSKA